MSNMDNSTQCALYQDVITSPGYQRIYNKQWKSRIKEYKGVWNKITPILRNCKQSFFARNINNGEIFWKTMKYLRKNNQQSQLDGKCADNELDKAKCQKIIFLHVSIITTTPVWPLWVSWTPGLVGGNPGKICCVQGRMLWVSYKT